MNILKSIDKMTPEEKVKKGICKYPRCSKEIHFAKNPFQMTITTGYCKEHDREYKEMKL